MYSYIIDGTTYYAVGDRLFTRGDEVGAGEIKELTEEKPGRPFLYDFRDIEDDDTREEVVRIETKTHWKYPRVKTLPYGDGGRPDRWLKADDFSGATVLESVIPNEIATCVECGGWGKPVERVEAGEEPLCLDCEYAEDSPIASTGGRHECQ